MQRKAFIILRLIKNTYILIFGLGIMLIACTDKKEKMLNEYAEIMCSYVKTIEERDLFDKTSPNNINKQIKVVKKEIETYTLLHYDKFETLNNQIKQAEKDFMAKYRSVTDKHSAVYGHVSTPGYEKVIAGLKDKRDKIVNDCNAQIKEIEKQRESDVEYKTLGKKLKELDISLKKSEEINSSDLKLKIDSLQKLLNKQNTDINYFIKRLPDEEQKFFISRLEELKENPCK